MMHDVHEVTHCGNCPFLYDGIECRVPGSKARTFENDDEWWTAQDEERPPAACPLLIAPSLVRIRAKALS